MIKNTTEFYTEQMLTTCASSTAPNLTEVRIEQMPDYSETNENYPYTVENKFYISEGVNGVAISEIDSESKSRTCKAHSINKSLLPENKFKTVQEVKDFLDKRANKKKSSGNSSSGSVKTTIDELVFGYSLGKLIETKGKTTAKDLFSDPTSLHQDLKKLIEKDYHSKLNFLQSLDVSGESRKYYDEFCQKFEQAYELYDIKLVSGELKDILGKPLDKNNFFWYGPEKREMPGDVRVYNLPEISRKNNSNLISNSSLLNLLMSFKVEGLEKVKTIHAFEQFSPVSYEEAFMLFFPDFLKEVATAGAEGLSFSKDNNTYNIKATTTHYVIEKKGQIKKTQSVLIPDVPKYSWYVKNFGLGKSIFGKWMNERLKNLNEKKRKEYYAKVREYQKQAGENIIKKIKEAIKNSESESESLKKLLRIHNKCYILSKGKGNNKVEFYQVPEKKEYDGILRLEEICLDNTFYNINSDETKPTQLNFNLTIKRTKSEEMLYIKVQVQVRFSHGAFAGVPEAKIYIHDDESYKNLYDQV